MKTQRATECSRMRMFTSRKCLVLPALVWLAAAAFGANASPDGAVHLPPGFLEALKKERISCTRFGLGGPGGERVPPSRIPPEVREKAYGWIRRVVKPQWLPEDGADRLVGQTRVVPAIPPSPTDFLWLDYPVAGSDFRITEQPSILSVLWQNPNITVGDDPAKTAVLLAQVVLQVPDGEAREMRAELQEVVVEADGPLFCGHITVPIAPLPPEQWENTRLRNPYWHKQWYHDMRVWLAPGYFYVSVFERTGQPVANPQRKPGSRPRFLPAE